MIECRTQAALPPEDVYGHAKKLAFIIAVVERRRREMGEFPLRILDFGCGSGDTVARYLIGPGVNYLGVDIHAPSLAYANEHFGGNGARFIGHLPGELEFDLIIYADVLEHLDNPAAVLRAHVRQLALGGSMVASVPNGFGGFEIERRLDRLLHLTPILRGVWRSIRRVLGRPQRPAPDVPFNVDSGHVVFFTRRSLNHTLAAAGLRITSFSHGTVVGADLSSLIIRGPLLQINAWLADRLPSWAVSTWHFEFRRADEALQG